VTVNILVRRSTAARADVRSRARGVARHIRRRVSGRLARGDRGSEYSDIRSQMVSRFIPVRGARMRLERGRRKNKKRS